PAILEELARLAPVTAVRGNNDTGAWASGIAASELVQVASSWLYVIHDLAELDLDPVAAGVQAVITGHSHKPAASRREGVLFVNPGSAGPRRFRLPISVGELRVQPDGALEPRLVELECR